MCAVYKMSIVKFCTELKNIYIKIFSPQNIEFFLTKIANCVYLLYEKFFNYRNKNVLLRFLSPCFQHIEMLQS